MNMGIEVNLLVGIKNLLDFINNNWVAIVVIVCLINAIAIKIKKYLALSDEDKIEVAKRQIKETMLKLITEAEVDYIEWINAGSIKRSQVIERIYTMYPVLTKVADQDTLIQWIDDVIDESLEIMRKIFEENAEEESSK